MKKQCDHFKLGRFRQTGRRIDDYIHAFIQAYNATKYHFTKHCKSLDSNLFEKPEAAGRGDGALKEK